MGYGIFTYIYRKFEPKVGKYTIHGSYGEQIHQSFWGGIPFCSSGKDQLKEIQVVLLGRCLSLKVIFDKGIAKKSLY